MVAPGLLLEGRYRLDSRIAAGGMGEVWRGADLALRRRVAVKLLLPEAMSDAEAAARFRAEARHAGMVAHPNIAQIFDYSEAGAGGDGIRRPYLVMELVDGPSLDGLLAGGAVGAAYTLDVLIQVAAGLAAAHAADLVHRDIKPANLLISRDGLVKITDFGIAHAAGAAPMTRTGVLVGTGAYLAPERAAGVQAGPAADLYSLGVVAYECLAGTRPFSGDALQVVLAHQTRPLPPLPPDVPEQVAALVADLTAKDPDARPPSAADVGAYAQQLRAELGGTAAARPDLPVLAAAVVSTVPQRLPGAGQRAAPHAGRQPWDTAPSVPGLPPAAEAGHGGADGEWPPEEGGWPQEEGGWPQEEGGWPPGEGGWPPGEGGWPQEERPGRPGRGGRRMGAGLAVAAVLVLAALGVWAFGRGPGQAGHVRITGRTHAAVQGSATSARHGPSGPPAPAATSALGTVPAAVPATTPAGRLRSAPPARTPTPVHSRTKPASPTPTQSTTPPPTPTPTPTPTGTPTPTPTPTGTG